MNSSPPRSRCGDPFDRAPSVGTSLRPRVWSPGERNLGFPHSGGVSESLDYFVSHSTLIWSELRRPHHPRPTRVNKCVSDYFAGYKMFGVAH